MLVFVLLYVCFCSFIFAIPPLSCSLGLFLALDQLEENAKELRLVFLDHGLVELNAGLNNDK